MHGSIQDRLESLLEEDAQGLDRETAAHLAQCAECSADLEEMRLQRSMLQLLRAPQELEPAAGFYARVMQRVEENRRESIWSALIYSPFSTRLIYASLTVALVLGSYMVAQESHDGHLTSDVILTDAHYDAPVMGNQAQQRNAVLVNFASH